MSDRTTTHSTHAHDGELAVFLIGMRLNKPHRIDVWAPTFRAMGRMIRELSADRAGAGQLGFLGARPVLGLTGPTVIQYWSSIQDLYAYANAPEHEHRPAWREFYQRARRAKGAVGIWHESFSVPAGHHESLYVDMPAIGLADAFGAVPMTRRGRTAKERLTGSAAA